MQEKNKKSVKEFWEQRGKLGEKAGSQDVLAKNLEVDALAKYLRDDMQVLEVGCGNGITALSLAERFRLDIHAVDYASSMIDDANNRLDHHDTELRGNVRFECRDITTDTLDNVLYDVAITERMLINLDNWDEQERIIRHITATLKPGGLFLMCEASLRGLNEINKLRTSVGLNEIAPPWHNCYIDDDKVEKVAIDGVRLKHVDHFSATYYFLSRVVNAWLAHRDGINPSYDAPINQLAVQLPAMGSCAQNKIWIWEKLS